MNIVRFRMGGRVAYGVLEGTQVTEYTGTPFTAFRRGRRRWPLRQVVLLPPVVPSKIVGVGLNYRDRALELGGPPPETPSLTLKPVSALVGPEDPIVCPPWSEQVEHEAELAVVIRRRCRNVPAGRAREFVLGYTCLNDVTARDLRARDGSLTLAKAFDTFCPIGPSIATDLDTHATKIEAYVNGLPRQSSSTTEMLVPVEALVAHVSRVMTLVPGDVIATGTPAGVGPLHAGDRVEIRIEGIGTLANPVVRI